MAYMINTFTIFAGNPDEKRPLGRQGIAGILKWILKKQGEILWTGFIWLRTGTSHGQFLYIITAYVSILYCPYFCKTQFFIINWKSLSWNGL
jgi:hypothetical protein